MSIFERIILIGAIVFFGFSAADASNLDNLRSCFLEGGYKLCIKEGEKLLAQASSGKDLEELYYILGLSYLKDGNYLRAADIFEIILQEFPKSKFEQEAKLGLADSYFVRRDYPKAESIYLEMLKNSPQSKLKSALYYRLSQLGKRTADPQKKQKYLLKLKSEFPQSPEVLSEKELFPITNNSAVILNNSSAPVKVDNLNNAEIISGWYSVQVGAFSSLNNAKSVVLKLKAQGFSVYIAQQRAANKNIYKVRVGGFSSQKEAKTAEKELKARGYSTKIIP